MESINEQLDKVRESFFRLMNPQLEMPQEVPYVCEVFDTYVIAEVEEKKYQINFTTDAEGVIVFDPRESWVEVEEVYQPVKMDTVVSFGGEVKAVKLDNGNVKLGGYLVRFGDATRTDVTGDYFTKETDYGKISKSEAWFNHRMPVTYKGNSFVYDEQLPDVELTQDEIGIFAEIVLGARNAYERAIAEWGLAGKLGWSSGTAPHLVDRKQVGKAWEITRWHLGLDASLTPTPAEPRNQVVPLKSISVSQVTETTDEQDKSVTVVVPEKIQEVKEVKTITGVKTMELEESKLQEMLTQASEAGATKAISALESVKVSGGIQVIEDEADRPFKSVAEMSRAVKDATVSNGRRFDPRLNRLDERKAVLGSSEGVLSDGGYLLEPTFATEILKPMHESGPLTSLVRNMPVGPNSNYGWINAIDETDRASRWGGVQGYWIGEGAEITSSKPKLRRINWELKKLGAFAYATDEQLADESQYASLLNEAVSEEISFMTNDAVFRGDGAASPFGIMNSPCLVTVSKETNQAADTVVNANLVKMWQRLLPSSRATSVWFVNSELEPELDQLYIPAGTAALEPRYVNYNQDGVLTIKGRPVVSTEFNAALGDLGDIVLVDMKQYLLFEKGGVQAASSISVAFTTDQMAFRWTYRCDGKPTLAKPITPYKGANTQSPFVTLQAR